MKKLFLVTGLLTTSLIASAQHVVSGTVTDKDGNPILGAKVEIIGRTETCITELDGTYSIETASPAKKIRVQYAGMQTEIKKIKPDMVVRLSDTNWWNEKPDKYRWLFSIQSAFPEEDFSNPSFGLMIGRMKNIGWYVKGVYSPKKSTEGVQHYYWHDWTTGTEHQSFEAITGGIIVRMGCPIYFYGGLGYANRRVAWEWADGSYKLMTRYSYEKFSFEAGGMLKLSCNLIFNVGTIFVCERDYFIGSFGVGYCF